MISIHYKKSYTYISCPVIIFITLILFIIINNISEDILSLKLSRKADSFLCELTSLAPHEERLLGRSPQEVMKAKSLHILIDVSAGLMQCLLPLLDEEKKKKRKEKQAFPKLEKLILRPQKWGRSSVYQETDPFEVSCREKSGSAQALLISLREKEILERCWSQLNHVAFSTPQGKSWPHQRAIYFFNTKKSDNCNPRLRN